MAVVKLGKPVKSNLGGPNGAMAYIIDPAKTDGGRLVSSNYERTGTDYDALADPMLEDNENSPKGIQKNSRLAKSLRHVWGRVPVSSGLRSAWFRRRAFCVRPARWRG